MLSLAAEGKNPDEWIENLQGESVKIKNIGSFSRREIEYYYKKYLILKENGHFENIDQEKWLSRRLTTADVKESIANTNLVTFEVTDRCSLKCDYCGYGEFYNNYDRREIKFMDIAVGVQMLNYLQESWNSSLNQSHDGNIYLGFYGGGSRS
jgi:uncharacterized protein